MATPGETLAVGALVPSGPFEGREGFRQTLRDAFSAAAREGWRDMFWCDIDYVDWPLGERSVVAALNAWAHPQRRLLILAADFQRLQREHVRFVEWRRTWDVILECRQASPVDASTLPSLLIGPGWALQRHDIGRCRGTTSIEAPTRVRWRAATGDALSRSRPGFPASTLGL
jgi:hypothetical protein